MKNLKKASLILLAIIMSGFVSCNKDDNGNNDSSNEIVTLTASPQTVVASTYTFGTNAEKTVNSIDLTEIDDEGIFIMLSAENNIAIGVDDDFDFTGTVIYWDSEGNQYRGENLSFEQDGEAIIFTGQVINSASDTKSLIITLQDSQTGAGNTTYEVQGEKATLTGTLGTYAYNQILEINGMHPNVNTIVLANIPGSLNDDINVETGRLIREAGYRTHLLADSEIYSGGVDLFCSGKTRTRIAGSKIGVHSWCCHEGQTADQLPQDSPAHDTQLAYFREMLGTENGPNFYFFTLQAAPFDGFHLMTDSEILEYQLITD